MIQSFNLKLSEKLWDWGCMDAANTLLITLVGFCFAYAYQQYQECVAGEEEDREIGDLIAARRAIPHLVQDLGQAVAGLNAAILALAQLMGSLPDDGS